MTVFKPGTPVPPKIKICGITRPEDASFAVAQGAEYVGLNFFAKSPRYIDVETAERVAAPVRGRASLVGVFVNHGRREVEEIAQQVGLDLLQFSGDEGPEDLEPFGRRAIKVFRSEGELDPNQLADYEACWGFLFDRAHKSLYGGTGEAWSYDQIGTLPTSKPVFLAGGIGPSNVREVSKLPGIHGLDLCSRVESQPGLKDPQLVAKVFSELRDG